MSMAPIAGDRIVDPTDPIVINRIAFTIRLMESNENYTALNQTASASGAYQIINRTWKTWAEQSGVTGASSYPRAYQAPPDIQDMVAKWKIRGILAAYGNHLAAVPVIWYYPTAWNDDTLLNAKPPGNNITVRDYAVAWIKRYDALTAHGTYGGPEGQVVPSGAPGIGTQIIDALTDPKAYWNAITSPFDTVGSMVDAVKLMFKILTSAGTWIRVLQVLGGLIALGMGTWILTHDTSNMVPNLPSPATLAMV